MYFLAFLLAAQIASVASVDSAPLTYVLGPGFPCGEYVIDAYDPKEGKPERWTLFVDRFVVEPERVTLDVRVSPNPGEVSFESWAQYRDDSSAQTDRASFRASGWEPASGHFSISLEQADYWELKTRIGEGDDAWDHSVGGLVEDLPLYGGCEIRQ